MKREGYMSVYECEDIDMTDRMDMMSMRICYISNDPMNLLYTGEMFMHP